MAAGRAGLAMEEEGAADGKPEHPLGLAAHNCLPYLLGSDATRWHFDRPDGLQTVEVRGNLRADNSLMLIDAMLLWKSAKAASQVSEMPLAAQ